MNADPLLRIPWAHDLHEEDGLLTREWLITNGIGGYASGTLAGFPTRRYHSIITAALPAPLGRYVMLDQLNELLRLPDGSTQRIGGLELAEGSLELHGMGNLREFRLEMGLPVWRYEFDGHVIEKWMLMPYRHNSVHVSYRLVSGAGTVRLKLRLAMLFRPHEASLANSMPNQVYDLKASEGQFEVHGPSPWPLRLHVDGERPAFTYEPQRFSDILYRIEEQRGYEAQGVLWSPGYFRADLSAGRDVTLIVSTENWDAVHSLSPGEALNAEITRRRRLIAMAHPAVRGGRISQLVLAADQFVVVPTERVGELARLRAEGSEPRTVIAGYHWFTDWGRDTMISLEGLTLTTCRHVQAAQILRTFAHHVRNGLIPNLFPEGESEGVYYTADATLWFFHALDRYLETTGDTVLLRELLPKLQDIIEHHVQGTRFGIRRDPEDGLLIQGDARYALTWMDAKLRDWVVTPRRGKAVEINALWHNALRCLEGWLRRENQTDRADKIATLAQQCRESFNRRFWNPDTGCLFDVVDGEDGNDGACRPNQLFALSLPHPVLDQEHRQAVLEAVRERLLTPFGLRTLAPDDPNFKPNYHGDLRTRDAAYHQGTVWPWLIGPFIDAWLQVYPDQRAQARRFLEPLVDKHLSENGVGSISEVFDAVEPFAPRGCIAQAWSVAEVLRAWAKTEPDGE
ncbi:glycogen debranching enzyme, putative [Desulfonatronum thiosulfatophilum]|uniref:Glycogen debranching enzyme, putative n=1 Tax=Desulfonatronum thiosulfatophilum TaxID=617002 RepID=A0A1G6DVK5_9BACT|nr:amylo-alpha-1,6-glucosidase [Desulfonatronum thiosulfatophilum]SDB49227.1 glycogen debranching enzyme, putative [Desulfonatronum thiosulfatophilum]